MPTRRYLTAVNSGTGSDMFAGGMSWGISLGGVGGLVDLKTQFPDDIQTVLDGNNPVFVSSIVGQDGKVYGVPYNQDVFLMYYLPDMLKQAGIDAASDDLGRTDRDPASAQGRRSGWLGHRLGQCLMAQLTSRSSRRRAAAGIPTIAARQRSTAKQA